MKEQTWIDPRCTREGWPSGEWDDEPDKVQWTDEATGFVCLAKRHPESGHWCGYVGVEPGHPWHSLTISYCSDGPSIHDFNIEVHSGITFGDFCQEGPPEQTVCHIPEPGKPDHLYWLGFDCHHAWDYSPQDAARATAGDSLWSIWHDQSYKSLAYVRRECAALAKQAASAMV